MVVGAFPAAKLGALLLKQISKPIANVLKENAKKHPFFRRYICMPPAQFYNWCEVKAKMWVLNLGKPVNIPVLNEAMAIELGANLLGEGIIFLIAAGILISEYNRSARKEAAKEEAKLEEMIQLQNTIRELFIQSEEQGAHIRELTRKIGDLETRIGSKYPDLFSKPKDKNKPEPSKPRDEGHQENSQGSNEPKIYSIEGTINLTSKHEKGTILQAVKSIEKEFWENPKGERKDGLLTLGLYHIYNNVLRLNV